MGARSPRGSFFLFPLFLLFSLPRGGEAKEDPLLETREQIDSLLADGWLRLRQSTAPHWKNAPDGISVATKRMDDIDGKNVAEAISVLKHLGNAAQSEIWSVCARRKNSNI